MIDAVIVPTLNQTDRLVRLLDSLDRPVGDVVIVDNGRRWPRAAPLPRLEVRDCRSLSVIELPANLGVAGAWNLGIKCAPHADRWLIVNDDAWLPPGSLQELDSGSSRSAVTLSGSTPPWSCFVLGDEVVKQVGLFDERFHPAYFEDTDYERRCRHAGVDVVATRVVVNHDNSSTLASGVGRGETYLENASFHNVKTAAGDMSWGWELDRRRALGWDTDAR